MKKKTLIAGIQIALGLGLAAPAMAASNISGLNLTGNSFNYAGGVNFSNSTMTFNLPKDGAAYGNMLVTGDYSATGTTIKMNTVFDAGGTTVSGQGTNRILINGNASGITTLAVSNNGGAGASTDLNGNGINDRNEGISLVQVSGTSSASAFALQGDYVAVGPYQYRLYSYQPGSSDPSQRLVDASAAGHWDYRLQNAKASSTPTPTPTPTPSPTPTPTPTPNPVNPPAAFVPQVNSYLIHNNSLFSYGQQVIGALHQRVGEIGGYHDPEGSNFEVYLRGFGSDRKYTTDLLSFYGRDYRQDLNGFQLGGNWLITNTDQNSLRLGLFYANGKSKTTPSELYDTIDWVAIGTSSEKTHGRNYAATLTWQTGGFYVDGVAGAGRYSSDVVTPFRGHVATLKTNSTFASVEAGYGWQIGDTFTLQPQAQLIWQQLKNTSLVDIDNVYVDLGKPDMLSWRVGVRALFSPSTNSYGTALTQYVKFNYFGNNGEVVTTFDDGYLDTGAIGNTLELGYGLSAAFSKNFTLYGDATWQRGVGSNAGPQGWTANLGLRWSF